MRTRRIGLIFGAVLLLAPFLHTEGPFLAAQTTPQAPNFAMEIYAGLGLFVLVVLNALLNAAESALSAIRPHHIRFVRESNPGVAAKLQRLLDGRDTHVAACGFGNRAVRLGIVVLILVLSFYIASRGEGEATTQTLLVAVAAIGLPTAVVNLILGEIVPNAYGAVKPVPVLRKLNGLVRGTSATLALPAKALVSLASVFTARFGGTAELDGANPLEEEIKTLAESGEESGQIESDERELIHSVFEFADTVAREIMTPRVDLDSMSITSDPTDVVRVIEETGHSRIPMYDGTDDDILGVVHAKDLLGAMAQGRSVELKKLIRPVLTVPEAKGVRDLLQEMRAARTQMAIVQDEFGGTAGVVTIEDIVEELVGDIVDEYDPEESEVMAIDGGWLVSGKTNLDDMNERIGTDFDTEEFDTVGGYVFGQFGRQPKEGESIVLERYRFTVTETDSRRILQLRIEPAEEPTLADEG